MNRAMEMAPASTDCDHRGMWVLKEVDNGLGVKYCEGCGQTFVLAQLDDGRFAWCRVAEHDEVIDELAEALLAMQADGADGPVQPGDEQAGRAPVDVPGVCEEGLRAEEDAGRDGGATDETLRDLPGAAADQPVQPKRQRTRRASSLLQGVPQAEVVV